MNMAKQIHESILESVSAQVLGQLKFDNAVFQKKYAASTYIRKTGWFMNSMTDIQRKHIGKILQGEIAGRRK